jgi:23S rRNA (uracil1939-C5)-methyltransferase
VTPTPPPTLLPTEATTTIEKLVAGGEGLGRLADGRVVFVAGALPQEQVSGAPVKHLGRWVLQSPKIQTPSPHRLTPPCPHATTCGGCDWQHLAIDQQRHWKTRLVHESLVRLGKVTDPPMADILKETDWAYRTTVSWEVVPGTTSSPARLAYHTRHNSGQAPGLIPFDQCTTLAEPLQRTATFFKPTRRTAGWYLQR